nr:hypothetical protein [Micrococcus terreus]
MAPESAASASSRVAKPPLDGRRRFPVTGSGPASNLYDQVP